MKKQVIDFSFVDAKIDRFLIQFGLEISFYGLQGLFEGVGRREAACADLGIKLSNSWGEGEYKIEKLRAIHWRHYGGGM